MTETLIGVFLILIVLCFVLSSLKPKKQVSKDKNAETPENITRPSPSTPVEADAETPGYISRVSLLTPSEADAFGYLCQHIADSAHICPKVRIADILKVAPTNDRSAWGRAFGKIAQKHIDFVIMNHVGDILFAIEVDDSSHRRPDRQKRDAFVNDAFKQAGVPLIRVQSRQLPRSDELTRAIMELSALPNQTLPNQTLKAS